MDYIRINTAFEELLDILTDEQAGRVFKAIMRYASAKEQPEGLDVAERMAFISLRQVVDAEEEKETEVSNKRSESGKKGGRPRKNVENHVVFEENDENQMLSEENLKNQMVFEEKQKKQKNQMLFLLSEEEKEAERETEKEKEKERSKEREREKEREKGEEREESSCAEPGNLPPRRKPKRQYDFDNAFILLPVSGGEIPEYPVPISDVEKFKGYYPKVDVEQEFRSMRSWIECNPTQKKTLAGINKFIDNWLKRAQNKGGGWRPPQGTGWRSPPENTRTVSTVPRESTAGGWD